MRTGSATIFQCQLVISSRVHVLEASSQGNSHELKLEFTSANQGFIVQIKLEVCKIQPASRHVFSVLFQPKSLVLNHVVVDLTVLFRVFGSHGK